MSEVTDTDATKDGSDVTELLELHASKLAAVGSPANGASWLVLKAQAKDAEPDDDDDETAKPAASGGLPAGFAENAARVKAGKKPKAKKSDSAEADEIEAEVTGEAAKATSYCGDAECGECVKAEIVPLKVVTAHASGVSKATLRAADRKKMPASDFAFVDSNGGKHLPIHDQAHVQSAVGRFGQQDFSGADDPDAAKHKAAGKIAAAANDHGIEVDDDSDVAQAAAPQAKKGDVQDALNGTAAPQQGGHLATGQSGHMQPATGAPIADDTTVSAGLSATSASAYPILAEERLAASSAGRLATKAMAAAALIGAITQLEEQRSAAKDGRYLQAPGPAANSAPGSMPWESYDAATLDQVAGVLASCCNAVESIATREQIEALSGDGSDIENAWDLSCAGDALESAMGIVARLSYHEQAAADTAGAAAKSDGESVGAVEKAYRRLRATDEKAVRTAHAALTNVLAEHDRASSGKDVDAGQTEPSEGDKIQMELTKEELAEQIAAATQKTLDADRKAVKKAKKVKKAEKAVKKAEQAEAEQARKNANNNGDITEQQLQDGVGSEHDADDIEAVGGKPDPKYINKSGDESGSAMKGIEDQLKAVTDTLGTLGEQVQKIAKRPRSGGPVLDGQARGSFPAAEARINSTSSDGETSTVIKSLAEQFEKAKEKGDPIAISNLGMQLTHARLTEAHAAGRI